MQLMPAVGVDYTKLRDALAASQWLEADNETGAVMLKIARRVDVGWLREEDITKFPCPDLNTIDCLWMKYSKGHFGFSVQSRIWQSVGEDYSQFADAVGWRVNYDWRSHSGLQFNVDGSSGHLPAAPFFKSDGVAIGWTATLSNKLAECCTVDF